MELENFFKKIKSNIKSKEFILTVITVAIIAFIAHAYRFFRIDLNYDYLAEYYASNNNVFYHRIELGRFVAPLIYLIRGRISAPWIIGLFGFMYITISAYLVIRFFDRNKKKDIVIISCFMCANLTLSILISTFVHDFDTDMLALLLAVIGTLIWKKSKTFLHYLLMVPVLILSLGLYQSYVAVCFTLIYFYSLLSFLHNGFNKDDFKKLLYGFITVLISMILYYAIANLISILTNIPLESRMNALDLFTKNIFNNLFRTYWYWLSTLFAMFSIYGKTFNYILGTLIVLTICISFLFVLLSKEIKTSNKIVLIIMFALLPFATNYVHFLSGGYFTLVMYYPTTALVLPLLYLFVTDQKVIELKDYKKIKICSSKVLIALLCVYLFCTCITSNNIYIKKETEANATSAYMNRVLYTIENTEGYVPGETPVLILGGHKIIGLQDGYDNMSYITGARTASSLGSTYKCYYDAYFEYVIKTDINIVDDDIFMKLAKEKEIVDMPCYPNKNAIAFYDGVLVVKLSEKFF